MSERQSPVDEKKKSKSQMGSFGALPLSMDGMKAVTSQSKIPDVARSVGSVSMQTPSFGSIGMPGADSFGVNMGPPSLKSGGSLAPPSFKSRPMVTGPSFGSKATEFLGTGSTWNVTDVTVQTLPENYPLEKTAVFTPHASVVDVAERITKTLKDRSISAVYNGSKASASCETRDGVKFRVFLYRGKNQYSHGIICEVQRRDGFSVNFHADTTAILDAAEDKTPLDMPTLSPPSLVPEDDMLLDDDDDDDFCSPPLPLTSLVMEGSLHASDRADVMAMGMVAMTSLSDSRMVGVEAASKFSTTLLEDSRDLKRSLVDVVLKKNTPTYVRSKYEDDLIDDDDDDDMEGPAQERDERIGALSALSNISANAESIGPIMDEIDAVVPVLLDDVRNSARDPLVGDLATRCLLELVRKLVLFGRSAYVESQVIGMWNANEALVHARNVGKEQNAALCEVATQCLRELESLR